MPETTTIIEPQTVEDEQQRQKNYNLAKAGLYTAGAMATASLITQPAAAQTTPTDAVDTVNTIIAALGTLAGAIIVVAAAPMAWRFAVKIVNRIMVKG